MFRLSGKGGPTVRAMREKGLYLVRDLLRTLYWRVGIETLVWITAFVYLAIHNPYIQTGFTICPLENIGFHYCPGCGLGRSVSFLLHGDVVRSFQTHILGIPATIIFLFRTFSLTSKAIRGKVVQASTN